MTEEKLYKAKELHSHLSYLKNAIGKGKSIKSDIPREYSLELDLLPPGQGQEIIDLYISLLEKQLDDKKAEFDAL